MDHFLLIDNLPVPDTIGRGGREPKYPFRTMRIGQAFDLFGEKALASARNAAYREKQRNDDFNYGAVEFGPGSSERERDAAGDIVEGGRTVFGRMWRVPVEEE